MPKHNILITREWIERAGCVQAALDEACSDASLEITPQAMTAYEAVGSPPEESGVTVQIEVRSEKELREAVAAGAEAVLLVGLGAAEARRLREVAAGLRRDLVVEEKPA